MEEVVAQLIPAVVGAAVGAIFAGLIQEWFRRKERKELGEELEKERRRADAALEDLAQYKREGGSYRHLRDNIKVTFRPDGSQTQVARTLIQHIPGRAEVKTITAGLLIDDLDEFLKKTNKQYIDLDCDKDFGISVLDVKSGVFLKHKTIVAGKDSPIPHDRLSTSIVLENPLKKGNPDLEYQITYAKLDSCVSFRPLWTEQHDKWISFYTEGEGELDVQLSFPKDLPSQWRKGDFGLLLSPPAWAKVDQSVNENNRLITLSAKNLEPAKEYSLTIDARVQP